MGKDRKATDMWDLTLLRVFALGALLSIALSYSAASRAASDVVPHVDSIRDNAAKSGKAYGVGGALDISGDANYFISNNDRTATATVQRVSNNSSTTTSGGLKLTLFVTTAPITGPFTYWIVGEQSLDPLPPNFAYNNLSGTVPLNVVPDGTYYIHIGIFEFEGSCGSSSGYCLDDYVTFPSRVQSVSGNYSLAPSVSVEYFHTTFGHYFVSGIAEEIAALDSGAFAGWVRTGLTFTVWSFAGGARVPVCRFFTTAFAPRSSHFYTPFANECAIVQGNPVWQYEGIVAYVDLPNAAGGCAIGIPLYRLYNNGMSGAPNHRYTTSASTRLQMIAQGWIPEGAGNLGVIACVPA